MSEEEINYWLEEFEENRRMYMSKDHKILSFYKTFKLMKQLQNNWNELKNWLKQQYKLNDLMYYNDRPVTNPKKVRIEYISKREELKEVLDKMQKLEDSVCEK